MNKRPTEPAPNATPRRPAPAPVPPKRSAKEEGEKEYMKKKYPFNTYAKGGKADKAGRALVKKSADTMGRAMKMNKGGKCYAGGGLVSGHKSADGCAVKGKTKGKMV